MAQAAASSLKLPSGSRIALVLPAEGTSHTEAAEIQARVLGLVMGALRSGIVPVMLRDCTPILRTGPETSLEVPVAFNVIIFIPVCN